jgi:hypothetical protein
MRWYGTNVLFPPLDLLHQDFDGFGKLTITAFEEVSVGEVGVDIGF